MIVQLTYLHNNHPLTVKVALCVIDSPDYQFLIGHDILYKLNFSLSAEGLTLTHPKTKVTALYEYVGANMFTLSTNDSCAISTVEPFPAAAVNTVMRSSSAPCGHTTKGEKAP